MTKTPVANGSNVPPCPVWEPDSECDGRVAVRVNRSHSLDTPRTYTNNLALVSSRVQSDGTSTSKASIPFNDPANVGYHIAGGPFQRFSYGEETLRQIQRDGGFELSRDVR